MPDNHEQNRAADAQAIREVLPLYRDVEGLTKAERDAVGAGLSPREAEAWKAIEEVRHGGDGWQDRLRDNFGLHAEADAAGTDVAVEVQADAGAVAAVDAYEDGGDADLVAVAGDQQDDGADSEADDSETADA